MSDRPVEVSDRLLSDAIRLLCKHNLELEEQVRSADRRISDAITAAGVRCQTLEEQVIEMRRRIALAEAIGYRHGIDRACEVLAKHGLDEAAFTITRTLRP